MIEGFPDRLRTVIEQTGLKREEFAQRTGVGRAQIFRYLKGDQEPTLSFLQKIKTEFPWVNLEWLAAGAHAESGMVAEPLCPYHHKDPVTNKIEQLLEAMTEDQRRDVLKYTEEKKLLSELMEEREKKKTG